MLTLVFSLLLTSTIIYCFIKKKYAYLFFPCFLFLPEFYGLEISESLPIITVSRLMTIIFYLYSYLNRRRSISFSHLPRGLNLYSITKELLLLFCYFLFRGIANLYYIATNAASIKELLSIIFEQLFILIGVYLLDPTKEEKIHIIESVVYSATTIFIIGLFESFTFIKPFNILYTVSRPMLNSYYIRLGLLRSTASLGLPNLFGNACILILPLILYLYNLTNKRIYLVSCTITIFSVIHSGCRSDIIFFFLILSIYAFFIVIRMNQFTRFIKNTFIISATLISIISILSVSNQHLAYFYSGTAKSILNEFGFNYDLNTKMSDLTVEYGSNIDGTESRTRQLTGIIYVAQRHPFIGLGAEAQTRGVLKYYWDSTWYPAFSYDVGVVEMFCNEGLWGLLGTVSLLFFTLLESYKNKNKFYSLCIASYMLSTLSSINMFKFLYIYIIVFSTMMNKEPLVYPNKFSKS